MNIFEIELKSLQFEERLLKTDTPILTIQKYVTHFETEATALLDKPKKLKQWMNDFDGVIGLVEREQQQQCLKNRASV